MIKDAEDAKTNNVGESSSPTYSRRKQAAAYAEGESSSAGQENSPEVGTQHDTNTSLSLPYAQCTHYVHTVENLRQGPNIIVPLSATI